jgi:pentatricopeptide repeat protein
MAEMREAGVTCDAVTFNSYMQLFVKAGDVEGTRGVMAEMREAGVTCDAVTYNSLLNCYAKQYDGGMLTAAEELIQEMDDAGLWADKQSFGALFKCCLRPPNPERAEFWFRRAVKVYEVRIERPLAGVFENVVGATKASAVYTDLSLDTQRLLGAGGNGGMAVEKTDKLCLAYVAGSCSYGDRCFKVHPPDGEVMRILEAYGSQVCRFGDGCRTNGCLYYHPGRPSRAEHRRGRKTCACCNAVGAAGGVDPSGLRWYCEHCLHEWQQVQAQAQGAGAGAGGQECAQPGQGPQFGELSATAQAWRPGQ